MFGIIKPKKFNKLTGENIMPNKLDEFKIDVSRSAVQRANYLCFCQF